MAANKITLNEIRKLVKDIIKENERAENTGRKIIDRQYFVVDQPNADDSPEYSKEIPMDLTPDEIEAGISVVEKTLRYLEGREVTTTTSNDLGAEGSYASCYTTFDQYAFDASDGQYIYNRMCLVGYSQDELKEIQGTIDYFQWG
jgi:hypothetical protein